MTRMWVQAPDEPVPVRPFVITERTSPVALTWRVMMAARRYTLPAAALSIAHQLGEALVPVIMGIAIERAVATSDPWQLLWWGAVLAADFAVLSFSYRFGSRIGELGMLAVQHALRSLVSAHLLTRRPTRGPSSAPGVALSLATSDVNRLAWTVELAVFPIGQMAAVLFGGAVLLTVSWPLGLAVILGAPALLWVTHRAGGSLRRRSAHEQEAAADAAGQAADLMTGYRVIKGLRAEDAAAARYRRASRIALARTLGARRAEGAFVGTMGAATGLFVTAIAVAAGLTALSGTIGVGELIIVVGLAQSLLAPLESLATQAGSLWAAGTASAGRLLDLLREREDGDAGGAPDVDDPGFGAGEIVAVRAHGRAARDVLAHVRAARPDALIVPHAAHLFAGTVRENVALPGIPLDRAERALVDAACEELASTLSLGWDTPVGEGGAALSGGQRQRVALARALAQDAPLLVLHEPTTAVDAVTEEAIAAGLRRARSGRSTVLVTRSPALLEAADRIIVPGEAR